MVGIEPSLEVRVERLEIARLALEKKVARLEQAIADIDLAAQESEREPAFTKQRVLELEQRPDPPLEIEEHPRTILRQVLQPHSNPPSAVD